MRRRDEANLCHFDSDPALDRIRKSLYDRALLDIRCAVDSGQDRLARLAFVGMAAWLDTAARLAGPRTNESGAEAIRRFVSAYMPEWRGRDRLLDRAFRCALLHEYGAGGVRADPRAARRARAHRPPVGLRRHRPGVARGRARGGVVAVLRRLPHRPGAAPRGRSPQPRPPDGEPRPVRPPRPGAQRPDGADDQDLRGNAPGEHRRLAPAGDPDGCRRPVARRHGSAQHHRLSVVGLWMPVRRSA